LRITRRQGKLKGFVHVLNLNFPLNLGEPLSLANEKMRRQQSKLCFWGSLDIMLAPYLLVLLWNQISQMLTIVSLFFESVPNRRNPLLGEASKKINWFFSEKLRKGGGGVSPNPKVPYQKKTEIFLDFFS